MPTATRHIGLSLGADLCWPICFEDIVRELDLAIELDGETLTFDVERVMIEPFDLNQNVRYDLVIDRLTHWYSTSREWIKKAVVLNDTYVYNNPWSVQSMEKQTSYCAMMRLGMPIPKTWLLPPKAYDETPELLATLERYAKLFDLAEVGEKVGYPLFMKPYDGGGWVGVTRVEDAEALRKAYDESDKYVMHLQRGIDGWERFVRCVGIGPQIRYVNYDPDAALHQRYREDDVRDFLDDEDRELLADVTLTINSFFGWDFNSCESLLARGSWNPIDFANPCPDSQVTSLHVHFPWLVKANLRWAIYCAATKKRFRKNLDWEPYFEIAERKDLDYRGKLRAYAEIAHERFETKRFEDFCGEHLSDLDEVAHRYFGGDRAREAVRAKVQSLFPEHEWDEFTDHFWDAIQRWRTSDAAERGVGATS